MHLNPRIVELKDGPLISSRHCPSITRFAAILQPDMNKKGVFIFTEMKSYVWYKVSHKVSSYFWETLIITDILLKW